MNKLRLCRSTNSWIARLPGNSVNVESKKKSPRPQTCRGKSGFATSVPSSNNNHIIFLIHHSRLTIHHSGGRTSAEAPGERGGEGYLAAELAAESNAARVGKSGGGSEKERCA
ncbi:hypothetical protein V8G54_003115 [Vigna mungo]|uniref:Uncharacterized protein n=1 Tax=Vigna mungo TaxID=3915 RepID=A0AAQ3SDE5_VIGMU